MKLLLITIQIILPLFTMGQRIWVNTEYYDNGQIYWKGNMQEIDNSSSPVGLWEYWYEDGSKKMETLENSSGKSFYLNMWLPNGEQILENGQGVLYEVSSLGDNNWDSSVYQIKDSIKHGFYRGYRLYPNHDYFQSHSGQYDTNSKKTGEWTFKDSVQYKSWLIENYLDDKLEGRSQHFYLNGFVKESGQYKNDFKEGEWKYFTENAAILKLCNYKTGRYIGPYREYHPSGIIKTEGQYVQGKGYIKINVRSIGRSKTHDRVENRLIKNKPLKQGVWKYFDREGKMEKVMKFEKDELLKHTK